MQIAQAAATAETPAITDETVVDPAAAALAEAAAKAPVSTEQALLDKANAERNAERPEGLPEKFNSWEDMAKAYAELEAKQSAGAQQPEAEAEADAPKEGEGNEATDDAPKAVDLKALSSEYETAGALSEATYADLAAKGFDKTTVDQFIAGQEALAAAATKRITDEAGGEDNLQRMFAWATTAMTPAEIDTYNASFANADVNAAVLAMGQLKAKYEAANGRDGKLLSGKSAAASVDVYSSWAEVTVDMGDPRYRSDPAFNAKVQQKLARSNNI